MNLKLSLSKHHTTPQTTDKVDFNKVKLESLRHMLILGISELNTALQQKGVTATWK